MHPLDLLPGIPPVESPLFAAALDVMELSAEEKAIAISLNEKGYAILDFPDPEIDARIDRVKSRLSTRFDVDLIDPLSTKSGTNLRIQDAWKTDPDVRAIASNPLMLRLLGKLYGRRAIPFQTLNFPIGTQQPIHSDSIHFSSLPERFMCGVWLAMEDIHDDAGPLEYYPGSHRWPIITNAMIGQRRWDRRSVPAQEPYQTVWHELVAASGIPVDRFRARKGQALIWAANLLHGGSPQRDPARTRWSQVTHYYFAECVYYTPAYSDEALGRFDVRSIKNIATDEQEPNIFLDEKIKPRSRRRKWYRRLIGR